MTPPAAGLRYVVLHHAGHGPPHFDLMFEVDQTAPLLTFRSPAWPIVEPVQLERLGDHRRAYLSYQGPVSGGRGEVVRVAEGTCDLAEDGAGLRVTFRSGPAAGTLRIAPDGQCAPSAAPSGTTDEI